MMTLLMLLGAVIFFYLYRSFGKTTYSNTTEDITIKPAVEAIKVKNNSEPNGNNSIITSKILEVKARHPNFVADVFIKQAEQTFDEVFNAFASSQHQILKARLSENLYEQFAEQIQKRENNNLRQEISIVHKDTNIEDIKLGVSDIEITVKFIVDQVSAMVDVNGVSYDNPSKLARKVQHTWVFVSTAPDNLPSTEGTPKWMITKTNAKEL